MKLKGMFNPEEEYQTGDVVLLEGNNAAFILSRTAPAGTSPIDTTFWNQLGSDLSECAHLIVSYQPQAAAPKTARKKKE